MRSGLLVILLAACSSPASASPAWPKPTVRESDGGESLAPRAAARTVAATTEDAGGLAGDIPTDRPVPPAAAAGAGDRSGAAPPTATPADEPLTGEDIVIEIED